MHRTLLLIEDDEDLQTLLTHLFRAQGYQVVAAPTSTAVGALLAGGSPHGAIVSGGRRSFAAGWSVAQRLRAAAPTLPLLMLTSNAADLDEVGQTARGSLFAAGLLKPFQLTMLLDTVARMSTLKEESTAAVHPESPRPTA